MQIDGQTPIGDTRIIEKFDKYDKLEKFVCDTKFDTTKYEKFDTNKYDKFDSTEMINDAKHRTEYPGYERQPGWIKNVVTEHCHFKAAIKRLEKEVADKDAILNVTKETRVYANNSKETIDGLETSNKVLQTRNEELELLQKNHQD